MSADLVGCFAAIGICTVISLVIYGALELTEWLLTKIDGSGKR